MQASAGVNERQEERRTWSELKLKWVNDGSEEERSTLLHLWPYWLRLFKAIIRHSQDICLWLWSGCSWRTAFPLVASAICLCIYNSLGINAGVSVGDPSSGDWQQTDHEDLRLYGDFMLNLCLMIWASLRVCLQDEKTKCPTLAQITSDNQQIVEGWFVTFPLSPLDHSCAMTLCTTLINTLGHY